MLSAVLSRIAALLVAVACVVAVGCGDDDSPDEAGGGSSGSGSAGATAGLERARADVEQQRKQPSDIGITEPLATKPTGKQVALVACGAPICSSAVPILEEPLKVLGIDVKVFNAGTTPDSITSTFNSVVQSKPDAVIDFAVPPILWKAQLASLKKADVPVIITAADPPPGQEDAVTATFFGAQERVEFGAHLANLITADSEGKGKALYVWTPELTGLEPQTKSFQETLEKNCPGCAAEIMTAKTSDIGKRLPSQVVSALQRNPDIEYVALMSGDLATGVPEALRGAGLSGVKVITSAGRPSNYEYIARGQQFADLSAFLPAYLWQVADATARSVTGQELPDSSIPTQWIEKDNADFEGFPPFGSDFQAEFKELWGVG